MRTILSLFLVLVGTASATPPRNVILVMFDGVRHEEFFGEPDPTLGAGDKEPIFPWFWGNAARRGIVYGKVGSPTEMTVANARNLSLPGYQSIFAGKRQECTDNECGRIPVETFPEKLVRELKVQPKDVATIASWDHIPLAVEHTPGSTFVNAGPQAFPDEADISARQAKETPEWKEARYDRFTFELARNYLRKQKPRFMFLSLNDSDEYGHLGRYADYLRTLRQYDAWLKELRTTLDDLGDYGKQTCMVVTTDHGRGTGRNWKNHGPLYFHAENVWLYTDCAGPNAAPKKGFSHLDIRPLIEEVFGISPAIAAAAK